MNQLHHLVIFGGQGSGKGTQAAHLKESLGLVHLSTGELMREIAVEDTDLGRRVHDTLVSGNLVSDEVVGEVVALKLGQLPPSVGFILDGYPRNRAQAAELHQLLQRLGRLTPKPVFIYLDVPRGELVKRLSKRRELEGRHDDSEKAIRQRLQIYEEQTRPLLDEVAAWADVLHIDGNQPIEDVAAEIKEKLDAAQG